MSRNLIRATGYSGYGRLLQLPCHWAFIEAGKDWRSLNSLAVADGVLRDFAIVPEREYYGGSFGVNAWNEPTGTVTGRAFPANGSFSVADPRFQQSAAWNEGQAYGVRAWDEPSGTITAKLAPGSGYGSVADPRFSWHRDASTSKLRVTRFDEPSRCVTGAKQVASGAQAVADPRSACAFAGAGKYVITPWNSESHTVIAGSTTGQGAFAVADPRSGLQRAAGDNYLTGGHYGVVPWGDSAGAVTGCARHDNGWNSVADPRLPEPTDKLVCVIRSLDGTWHRPFTTLELAAIQSLVDPEEYLELDGLSDSAWRERIGNAVPPDSA